MTSGNVISRYQQWHFQYVGVISLKYHKAIGRLDKDVDKDVYLMNIQRHVGMATGALHLFRSGRS